YIYFFFLWYFWTHSQKEILINVAEVSHRTLYWFKQSPGDALKLIVTQHKFGKPEYTSELSESRSKVDHDNDFINLTIVRTIKEDEGMYHCAVTEWIGNVAWNRFNPTVSDPVLPGGSVSLQCSVLSQSETKTCPEGHSVYWVRAGPDKYHPEIIYADGNECEESSDLPKSCVYRLPKNISSSDSGTYHCAVAVCGEILFGNGTKVDNQGVIIVFILLLSLLLCSFICQFIYQEEHKSKK
uniref:Ig-like domain-containing protein n=1 Tax=Echeneis naucrates TaxID=173247 RepID=A0A665WDW7_ECHNA